MSTAARRVLVTRPRAQAAAWVQALREQGLDAVALPLVEIAGPVDADAVGAAWRTLASRRLVMFVSANAARGFFARAPAGMPWPAGVRAAATGPGTASALQALGVPADAIDAPPHDAPRFDSEALWERLAPRDWQGARVLVVRGDGGREWLGERFAQRGAEVEHLVAYRRLAPALDAAERARLEAALAAPASHLWLFSSSEAVANLEALASAARGRDDRGWRAAVAVTTHPRIAESVRRLGFGAVHEARATPLDVVACIQSIRP